MFLGSILIDSQLRPVFGSGMPSQYLTFLDICSQFNIFSYVNDGTRAVELPSSFSFGRISYNNIYVS